MSNVSPYPTWINLVSKIVAYIDTADFHFRYMAKGLLAELRRTYGRRVRRTQCIDEHGRPQGWRITLHQPTQAMLRLLEKRGGVLSRFDAAYDISAKPGVEPAMLDKLIREQTMLRWCPRGPMHDIGNTTYAVEQQSRDKRSNRDLGHYNDRPGKATGERNPSHVELRILDAGSVKRQKITTIDDLIEHNPKTLFIKHVKVVAFDADKAQQRFIRKAIKQYRRKPGQGSNRPTRMQAFLDAYEARLPKLLATRFDRAQFNRVQVYAQYHPKAVERMKAGDMKSPDIDEQWTWGARPMIEITKELKQRGVC